MSDQDQPSALELSVVVWEGELGGEKPAAWCACESWLRLTDSIEAENTI